MTQLSDTSTGVRRSSAERLRNLLTNIRKKKITGRLSLVCPPHRWYLFFDLGQCVYATGSHHRIRRWNRALQMAAPGLDLSDLNIEKGQPWEYNLLTTAIYNNRLTVDDGVAIAMVGLREILFAIVSCPDMSWHWHNTPPLESAYVLGFMLDSLKVTALLDDTIRLHRQWTGLGLDLRYVNCTPVIHGDAGGKMTKTSVFSSVHTLLDGNHSFWDVALISPAPLAMTTRIIHHFLQQGLLTFHPLPDLPMPSYLVTTPSSKTARSQAPLIACIDDSPQVCRMMEAIMNEAGYRFLGIPEPLKALPELLQHQPDFIFLDLVMPVVGGYELCKQLRRAESFKDTPIVILTGRDGMVARMKSNMVGATEFLSKPIDEDAVLHEIKHHLASKNSENPENSEPTLTEMAVETALQANQESNKTYVA